MTVPDDDPTWQAFVAAMEVNPGCTRTMAVAADYLQECGDTRWEPLMWLAENGKTGLMPGECLEPPHHDVHYIEAGGYFIPGYSDITDAAPKCLINKDWFSRPDGWPEDQGCVWERLSLIQAWVNARPHEQHDWLTDPCKTQEPTEAE